MKPSVWFLALAVLCSLEIGSTFQLGKVLSSFIPPAIEVPLGKPKGFKELEAAKVELLQTISSTKSGKDASLEIQTSVLRLVNYLETQAGPSKTLLTNPAEAVAIDGVWYLQYTQPSDIGVSDIEPWTPESSTFGPISKIDTRPADNKGTVSFLGMIAVDASNRLTTQTIDFKESTLANFVEQDFGSVLVRGSFELDTVPNRVVVSFEKCEITLKNGFVIDLSFLFSLRAALKGGNKAGGWLETTYLDEDMRIGRGNRGSLFILTRDAMAVTP
jgi:PAP_fibrillin